MGIHIVRGISLRCLHASLSLISLFLSSYIPLVISEHLCMHNLALCFSSSFRCSVHSLLFCSSQLVNRIESNRESRINGPLLHIIIDKCTYSFLLSADIFRWRSSTREKREITRDTEVRKYAFHSVIQGRSNTLKNRAGILTFSSTL